MWRDTARPPRMGPVDARAAWACLVFILHISLATLGLVIAAITMASLVERRGYTPHIALRVLRMKLAGRIRPVLDNRVIVSGAYWKRRTWGIR